MKRGEPVDHRHRRALGELDDRLVRARPDHDRVQVAREDPRGVRDRLAAAELELVGAQRQRVGPELGDPDPERDPGPGRGAARSTGRPTCPRAPRGPARGRGPALSSAARASSASSSAPESSSPVRKCLVTRFKQGILWALAISPRPELEPLPRPRSPARSGAVHAGARGCCGSASATPPIVQVNRDLLRRVRRGAGRGRVGRRPAAGVSAAMGRAAGAGDRRRGASGAHLAQLVRRAALDCWPRLNPDLIASNEGGSNLTLVRGAVLERRELVLAPGAASGAARDGVHAGAARRVRRRGRDREPARERRAALRSRAEAEVLRAARTAVDWAGGNAARLRRRPQPPAARERASSKPSNARPGCEAPRPPTRSITCSSPGSSSPSRRPHGRRSAARSPPASGAIRLSDHAPVTAAFS